MAILPASRGYNRMSQGQQTGLGPQGFDTCARPGGLAILAKLKPESTLAPCSRCKQPLALDAHAQERYKERKSGAPEHAQLEEQDKFRKHVVCDTVASPKFDQLIMSLRISHRCPTYQLHLPTKTRFGDSKNLCVAIILSIDSHIKCK